MSWPTHSSASIEPAIKIQGGGFFVRDLEIRDVIELLLPRYIDWVRWFAIDLEVSIKR